MKHWIVYQKPDGELDAVEDLHNGLQEKELTDELNIIRGNVSNNSKDSAINWIEGK